MIGIGTWLILAGVALLIPTAYAGHIGAPYAPTRIAVVKKAFDAIGLGSQDVLFDLGVGDGKILLEADTRGAKAVGYELSPIMYCIAFLRAAQRKGVTIHFGNFFNHSMHEATVIFAFLMPKHMDTVRRFITEKTGPNLRYVLAYAFPFPSVQPLHVIREKGCAPLYVYDAEQVKGEA